MHACRLVQCDAAQQPCRVSNARSLLAAYISGPALGQTLQLLHPLVIECSKSHGDQLEFGPSYMIPIRWQLSEAVYDPAGICQQLVRWQRRQGLSHHAVSKQDAEFWSAGIAPVAVQNDYAGGVRQLQQLRQVLIGSTIDKDHVLELLLPHTCRGLLLSKLCHGNSCSVRCGIQVMAATASSRAVGELHQTCL